MTPTRQTNRTIQPASVFDHFEISPIGGAFDDCKVIRLALHQGPDYPRRIVEFKRAIPRLSCWRNTSANTWDIAEQHAPAVLMLVVAWGADDELPPDVLDQLGSLADAELDSQLRTHTHWGVPTYGLTQEGEATLGRWRSHRAAA